MSIPEALVTGDVILDTDLYGGVEAIAFAPQKPATVRIEHLGGAALSHRIMKAAADADAVAWTEKPEKPPRMVPSYASHLFIREDGLQNSLRGDLRSYGVWTPYLPKRGADADAPRVWRMQQHLGYGSRDSNTGNTKFAFSPTAGCPQSPSVILVDDGSILFRHAASKPVWPELTWVAERSVDPFLIVLKMSAPICWGDLWQYLKKKVPERLLVIVSAEDLRQEDAEIRKHLSWEQCAIDALGTLHEHPLAKELLHAAHIVMNFGSEGALWLRRDKPGENHKAELIYDPIRLEGDHSREYEGSVYGFQSCLAVAIAHRFMTGVLENDKKESKKDRIAAGIVSGLKARRKLLELGHGQVGKGAPGFPIVEIGKVIAGDQSGYVRARLSPSSRRSPYQWSILAESEQAHPDCPLVGLAQMTAIYGRSALSHVPTLSKGSLLAADRSEIESLRTLERLILEYEAVKPQNKPLSIGVFGPPGAGKSFGVKALSKAIFGKDAPILEFNLSQFKDPEELVGAFHRVQDTVLKGITPVAFWDEFDSQSYRWLQYLLAPMQDGAFQEGQITHPIGKCVFIFAGGTADSLETFGVPQPKASSLAEREKLQGNQREDRIEAEGAYRNFKLLKGPDFISRLHGYLNILGPNPKKDEPSGHDRTWPIRRALLLRSLLGLGTTQRLDMDTGLLLALLRAPEYAHGSRSFEKILQTIRQGRNGSHYHRSSLPPDSLLDRETDAKEFHAIMNQHNEFKTNADIEKLAAAIHQDYLNNAQKNRWRVKPEVNKPYEKLAPDYQTSNRAAAQRIPDLLALISFRVVPNRSPKHNSWKAPLKKQIRIHRERLAQAEHLGWTGERIVSGWTYASKRNDAQKQHDLIVDWTALSDSDKEKDRKNMDSIPIWLELAGYKAELVGSSK